MAVKRILKLSTAKETARARSTTPKRFPFLDSTDTKRKKKKGRLIESACYRCGAPVDTKLVRAFCAWIVGILFLSEDFAIIDRHD